MDRMFDLRSVDFGVLNSLTKYPSIPTHHALDPKNGGLLEPATTFDGTIIGTEKVDGTNGRIIVLPDGSWIIGSREELLHARGDIIANPALGIANALKDIAEHIVSRKTDSLRVFYLEVFGGKVTAASKHYTSTQMVSARLFDVVELPAADAVAAMRKPLAEISLWRENKGQSFLDEAALQRSASEFTLSVTPRIFTMEGSALPGDIVGMHEFLKDRLPTTQCSLDSGAGGRPEGIVLRSTDRRVITKARFEDYERTARRRK
jgi:RNA ligase